ncbi:primary-amine oxidase [Spirillospora sp. NPDC048911]|uniref:primary-amine oxidase n=1 Tax=Spirillospora sp. NPDC048911 TaxID=3364527 RepID=UPI0037168087
MSAESHPLDPLSASEICEVKRILVDAGLMTSATRVAFLGLEEPDKSEVLGFRPGAPIDRRARVLTLDAESGRSRDLLVSISRGTVDREVPIDPATQGQVPILGEEFTMVEEIVSASAPWRWALERRGLEPEQVRCVPLSAGCYGDPAETGRRIIRCLGFRQDHPKDHPWAHPVDGLAAYVDLIAREVTRVVDEQVLPVPDEPGNYDDGDYVGPARETPKPIRIERPEGSDFTVEGMRVTWQNWSLRLGFNAREGLTLHQVAFKDGPSTRPIIYRASIAEMVVPYGDPSPVRYWQNYFDIGEYLLGQYANSLELGCDCIGDIHYFDAVLADERGEPRSIRNAICMHEEDYGVLWKHTDLFTEARQTRRQRRLVISFFSTVGNYDYGFYWYLYLDGTIEFEAKLTGVLFTCAYPGQGHPFASQVAPGLGAPYHQHLFTARLDMMVDGSSNAVDEISALRLPPGPCNPHGNAFTTARRRLVYESEGQLADQGTGRVWHVLNTEKRNRLGQAPAYVLHPQGRPVLLADPSSSIAHRAAFAGRHLWVTPYHPDERYPAGDLVNQHPGGDGLPAWTARGRAIDGADIVLWHTFGMTHFPRTEDWPVMPVDHAGFVLKPSNFFDRNPTLDLPAPSGGHCETPSATDDAGTDDDDSAGDDGADD